MARYSKEMELFFYKNYPYAKNNNEFAMLFNSRFKSQFTSGALKAKANSLGIYRHGIRFTPEMHNFIKENNHNVTRKELADKLNEHFGVNKTTKQIKGICYKYGYTNKNNVKYSKEMKTFIHEKYPYIENNYEFASMFNSKFSTNFTKHGLQLKANQLGVHKNWHKRRDIGDEYSCNGITYIKGDNNKWVYKKEYIYKQNYSNIYSNEGIIFIDGNCQNFNHENLLKLKRNEIRMMAKFCFLKKDTQTTMLGLSLVRLKIMADTLENQQKPKKQENQ